MQARTPITLDPLLTLLGGPKSNGSSGVPSQVPADILLFGDMLGLLGNFGADPSANGLAKVATPDQTIADPLTSDPDLLSLLDPANANPAFAGALAASAINVPVLPTDSASQPAEHAKSQSGSLNAAMLAAEEPSDALDAFAAKIVAQAKNTDPASSFFVTNGRPNAWSQIPNESVPDGSFKVISSQLLGDQLQLELQSRENPATLFKLTVPTATLAATADENSTVRKSSSPNSSSRAHRVALTSDLSGSIDELFGRLNVTDLHLTNELPVDAARRADHQVTLELTGHQAGRTAMITLITPKSALRLLSNKSAADQPDTLISPTPAESTNPISKTAPNAGQTSTPATSGTEAPVEKSASFSIRPVATKWDTEQFTDDSTSAIKTLQSGLDRSEQLARPVDVQAVKLPVKFTLEDLPKVWSGATRTLSVKLEPEHLGPARLYLSAVNDTINARLSVETPTAKAAVERGLDQLTDQLSRAGIRVNHIEVSLRGGSYQESAYRQTNWFRPQRSQLRRSEGDPLAAGAALAAVTTSRPSSYLGASGVNLYA